ncbi:hypothetical protein GCM10023334_081150 [Nonomuraea thailandensis]
MDTPVTGMPENIAAKAACAPTPTASTTHRCRGPYARRSGRTPPPRGTVSAAVITRTFP